MKVKFKKLSPDAVTPTYARVGDGGLDLTAITHNYAETASGRRLQVYGTGLAVEIPEGHVGLIFPRSSVSRTNLSLTNSVGVIDSGYRGEIQFKFGIESGTRPSQESTYKVGDKIGQLVIMPYPTIELEEVTELSSTERGENGFGSTGK